MGRMFAPYWDDLDMRTSTFAGGGIYTATTGSPPNRQFIIEWRAEHYNGGVTGAGRELRGDLHRGLDDDLGDLR